MKISKFKKSIAAVMAAAMCVSAVPAQFGFSASAAAEYSVTVESNGNGSVATISDKQAAGSSVTLSATPDAGYEFDHWEIKASGTQFSKTASLVFALDTTGSMDDEIEAVKDNLTNLVKSLEAKSIGLNISIIDYSDAKNYDGSTHYHTFQNGTHWTTDVNEAVSVFDSIKIDPYGYDETPTDAFTQLLNSDGTLNFPAGSVNNYIFLLTDEGYYDFKDTPANAAKNRFPMATWIDKFAAEKVKVSVVTTKSCKSKYEDLFTKTGGIYIDIKSSDYSVVMDEFSVFLDQTSVELINETSYQNPHTFTMPAGDVTAKAFFKPAPKSAYTIRVITDGHGDAYANRSTAYGGETIYITAKPDDGYELDSMECIEGGAVLNGNRFTMPKADVVIFVSFKEDLTKFMSTARPYSYVFTYDSEMNLIDTFANRSFKYYPEYVLIKIDLGEDYAGRTGDICTGRKSSDNVIKTVKLDENGCYVFKADIAKNYSFVLAD